MSLKIEKLENVNHNGSRIIARCPACAEQGHDNKGDHLSIDEQGRFTCVKYPGNTGEEHRKRIFALVGDIGSSVGSCSRSQRKVIKVKQANRNTGNIIKRDVLGHLGRVNQTLKKVNKNDIKERIYNKEYEKGVPSVPSKESKRIENGIDETETEYTAEELRLLEGVSEEGLAAIDKVKSFFGGKVVEDVEPVKDNPNETTAIKACKHKSDIEEQAIEPSVEKSYKCGRPATTSDFGEIENGKFDWSFYCNSCNPRVIDCRECGSRAIPYVNSSDKHILNKCNVHGARLKVTHADIDAWSREKERNRHSNTEGDDQSKRPF